MSNNSESWHSGYVAQDIDQRSMFPPLPEPLSLYNVAGHPFQRADRSFLGKNSPEDLDAMASELAFKMQHRQQFRKQFTKTQLCRYHLSGGCRKGANCEFAHGSNELARPPDLRRTSICKDWLDGKCPLTADTCKFAHGNAFLRRTLDDDIDDMAAGSRPAASSSEFEPTSGPRMRDGTAKLFTAWEQQLLKQKIEQEEMKETIRAQQQTIDALISLQTLGSVTPGQHPALPKTSKKQIQSAGNDCPQHMQQFVQQYPKRNTLPSNSQGFPTVAIEYPQQMRNLVPQYPEHMSPLNSHGFPDDAIDADNMQRVVPQYPERQVLPTDAIDAEHMQRLVPQYLERMLPSNSHAFPIDAIDAMQLASQRMSS